jgi:hypothetical protein
MNRSVSRCTSRVMGGLFRAPVCAWKGWLCGDVLCSAVVMRVCGYRGTAAQRSRMRPRAGRLPFVTPVALQRDEQVVDTMAPEHEHPEPPCAF